jgi:hypothetical protein
MSWISMRSQPIVLATSVAVCWLVLLAGISPILTAPAAIAILFVLPGLALLEALGLRRTLGPVERLVLAVGGSCAIVILLVIGIGLLGIPIRPPTVVSSLAALMLGALAAPEIWNRLATRPLIRRDHATPEGRGFAPPLPSRVDMALWLSAVGLGIAAVGVTVVGAPPAQDVVQLWMIPRTGGAQVGIYNGTETAKAYTLTVGPGGTTPQALNIEVPAGGSWEQSLGFPPTWSGAQAVTARLYQDGDQSVVRSATLVPLVSAAP